MLEGINLESTYGNEISTHHLRGHGIELQCRVYKNSEYVSFLFPDKVIRIVRGGSFDIEEKSGGWQSFFVNGTYFARVEKGTHLCSRLLEKKFHILSRILSMHIRKGVLHGEIRKL